MNCEKCGGEIVPQWKSEQYELVSCVDCGCWFDLKEVGE